MCDAKAAFFLCHYCSSSFDCGALCIALRHRSGALDTMSVDELMNCSHALTGNDYLQQCNVDLTSAAYSKKFIRFSY